LNEPTPKKTSNKQAMILVSVAVTTALSTYYLLNRLNMKSPDAMVDLHRAKLLFNDKFNRSERTSVRTDDVNWIKKQLTRKIESDNEFFTVVLGPKRVGQTFAVRTAANGLPGVIEISDVESGTSKDEILRRVFRKINDNSKTPDINGERARNVIESYKVVSGGQVPIVIINTMELYDKQPAGLTAAALTLTKQFNLNVLIDARENSVDNTFTGHENILEVKPMTDGMMRELHQFKKLLDYLVKTGNDKIVLAVCSGSPLLLGTLYSKFDEAAEDKKDIVIRNFVGLNLGIASSHIRATRKYIPHMSEVC
jgi:hypothetical protein